MKCEHWDKIPENFASAPECAFNEDGSFNPDNWNCFLMNKLREAVGEKEVWSEDQYMTILPFIDDLKFAILTYYKHRGRTEGFWVWEHGRGMREGTRADAEEWLKAWNKKGGPS